MDHFNEQFTSENYESVANFYSNFSDSVDLIEWMKSREDGRADIFEIDGDTSIVVVIPTQDHEGKYSSVCKSEIFKGLHIVFVESGVGDPLFNYARNSNIGIQAALKLEPDWIIQSNDDMFKIDDVAVLRKELSNSDNRKYDTLFTSPPGKYHSHTEGIGMRNGIRNLYYGVVSHAHRVRRNLENRFQIDYMIRPGTGFSKIMLKHVESITMTQAFSIFSPNFLRKFRDGPYDPVYINNIEEFDLSYLLNQKKERLGYVHYKIGDIVGGSFGNGKDRWFRTIACEIYFNHKLRRHLKPFETFLDNSSDTDGNSS